MGNFKASLQAARDGDVIAVPGFIVDQIHAYDMQRATARVRNDRWIPDALRPCEYCDATKLAPSRKTCANCGAPR